MRQEAELELIQSGNVTADDLHAAKEKSRRNRVSILLNLLEGCSAKKCDAISAVLARHYKIPLLSLDKTTPPHRLMKLCNAKLARKLHFLPIAEYGSQVVVGMVDPLDLHYDDEVRAVFQRSIQPVFITLNDFERNYHRFFRKGISLPSENPSLMNTKALTKAFLSTEQMQSSSDNKDLVAKKFVATIISRALTHKASSFSIEPQQDVCLVNLFQDGHTYNLFRFSMSNHEAMLKAMMNMAKIDPFKNTGVDQFSRCRVNYQGQQYILCYNFRQTPTGERVVVHILDPNMAKLPIEDLGFSHQAMASLKKTLENSGIVLVTGSSGSGKSTTLQAMIRHAATLHKNIFTIEDIIGLNIEGVRQFQVKPNGPSKTQILKALQKNNADVIVIDAIDKETFPAVLDVVESGCLVLLSLDAENISSAISKLLCTGISRSRLASTLKIACTHKTVRQLCSNCKKVEKLHSDTIMQWQIPEHLQFQNANGCEACNHKAYVGTMSLSEALTITPDIAALIKQGASGPEIFEAGRAAGMLTLVEQGVNKALAGLTSLTEVLATMPYQERFSVKNRMRIGRIMPLQSDESLAASESKLFTKPKTKKSTSHTEESASITFSASSKSTKQKVVQDKVVEAPAEPQQTANEGNKALILLVDDSPVTLEFTRHILNVSGHFHVDIADTAMKALKMLEKKQYHLVITDQEMPEQTGQEFIETIRHHPSFNHVGTILLTGNLNEMSALESGADGYIAKPTDPELLVARAKSISDIYKRLSDSPAIKPISTASTTSKQTEKVEFTEKDMAKISNFELDSGQSKAVKKSAPANVDDSEKVNSEFDKLFE
jgi:type IV pilus assembly protein PilB